MQPPPCNLPYTLPGYCPALPLTQTSTRPRDQVPADGNSSNFREFLSLNMHDDYLQVVRVPSAYSLVGGRFKDTVLLDVVYLWLDCAKRFGGFFVKLCSKG